MIANAQILGWGLLMVIASVGWGAGVYRLASGFRPRHLDWGLKAVIGLGATLAAGGAVNYLSLFSREITLYWIAGGLLLWIADWILAIFHYADAPIEPRMAEDETNLAPQQWTLVERCFAAVGSLILLAALAFQIAGWVHNTQFNPLDDYHAYFVDAERLVQTGGLGDDPFATHRLKSALGGHSILLAGLLSFGRLGHLNLLEPGLAIIVLVGVLLGRLKRSSFGVLPAFLLLLLVIAAPYPKANLSAEVLGIAMLLGLWRLLDECDDLCDIHDQRVFRLVGKAAVLALTVAGVSTLQTAFFPVAIITLLVAYAFYVLSSQRAGWLVLGESLLTLALTGLLLLPWMLAAKPSTGTLFYPFTGLGHITPYFGHDKLLTPWSFEPSTYKPARLATLAMNPLVWLVVVTSGALVVSRPFAGQWLRGREATLSLLLGALVGAAFVWLSDGHIAFKPLAFPILFVALLAAILRMTDRSNLPEAHARSFLWRITLGILAIGLLLGTGWEHAVQHAQDHVQRIRFALADAPAFDDAKTRAYRGMQTVVPQGEAFLVRIDEPFRLNFARNTIYVADRAGEVGPSSGLRLDNGPEGLANYLQHVDVRYVAYSYKNEANFTWRKYQTRTRKKYPDPHGHQQANVAFTFHRHIVQLSKTRERIYDDGEIFVLDLDTEAEDLDEMNERSR